MSIDRRIDELWFGHTIEYHITVKMNELELMKKCG